MVSRRPPTQVTADRIKRHYEHYFHSLSGSQQQVLSDAIYLLETIANTWEAVDDE